MTEPSHSSPESWPPREGKTFFLLWIAGLFAQATAMRLVGFALQGGTQGAFYAQGAVVFAAVAVAAHAWQGWLLFRTSWRMFAWAVVPCFSLLAPGNFRWIQMMGIIAPLIETGLLAGIRLRAWAWLLAGMVIVMLTVLASSVINAVVLGMNVKVPGASSINVAMAAHTGFWLLCECGAAAILAWKMPPITAGSRTAPPLPPGSTDA